MSLRSHFRAVGALCQRELIRFLRQRSRVIGAFVSPLLFWLLLGFGIDGASDSSSVGHAQNFKQYFVPGAMIMGILFTSIYSAISLIEDKNSGFLQGLLVSPLSRWSLVLSKILGASSIALIQGFVLFPLVFASGLRPGLLEIFASFVLFFMMSFFIASLALHFGWRIQNVAGFHGIMNTVLMPMWFLSGATFPIRSGPLYWISRVNPLSYAVQSFQELIFQGSFLHFGLALAILAVISSVLFSASLLRN